MSDEQLDERWAPTRIEEAGEADDVVYVLGLREHADDEESWALLLMGKLEEQEEYDDEDETYCLVVDPDHAVAYGGVLECELSGNRLRLLLTEETAATLSTPTELSFELAVPADRLPMVSRGLTRVFTSGRESDIPRVLSV